MTRYSYHLTDYRNWLKGFARLLHLPIIEKKLTIPPHQGEGFLYASNIGTDISFVIMNFSMKEDLVLHRKKSPANAISLGFNQVDVSDFFKITHHEESIVDKTAKRSNIFLSSTNFEMELTYSRLSRFKTVSILFSQDFVQKYVKKDILLDILLYTDQKMRNVNREPITFEYRLLLDDIFEMDLRSPLSNLVLQNRVLMLTEKFLHTFLEKKSHKNYLAKIDKKRTDKDLDALKDVETILSNRDLEKFPSINELSRTAMMSSTKLKNKFKQVYGMKLYEFYNRSRLEKARSMLQSGDFSVKQVGREIGFSNLSNFAKAFKKEFGVLPNEMLRK